MDVWPFMVRRVQGHSMVPVLPPNMMIVAWRRVRKIRPNDIVVFTHDNREKIKRVHQVRGEELFLVGDHSSASTDSRHFGWVHRSTVIGKVILPRKLRPVPEHKK